MSGHEIRSIPDVTNEEMLPTRSEGSGEAETESLGAGKTSADLQRESRENAHNQQENFKRHFSLITIVALYALSIGAFVFALVWSYHVLLPESCHWLSTERVEAIQNMVTGGVLAALLAQQFEKRIK